MKKCTLLLSTYDGGEDLWDGFFKALSIQWPEFDMPIVINTETKNYSNENFNISVINSGRKTIPWGKRIKNVLQKIETEYVLLFLEDYWLVERVDNDYFEKTLNWLDENKDVSTFSFYPCMPGENIKDKRFERMERRPDKCKYKFNCQVSLWRREDLIRYIRNHESPWEWEMYGSIRATRYKKCFYTLEKESNLCFSYGDPFYGCLIKRGKWVKEIATQVAEKYGLIIDFNKRGFITKKEINEEAKRQELSFFKKLKLPHLLKRSIKKIYHLYREILSII